MTEPSAPAVNVSTAASVAGGTSTVVARVASGAAARRPRAPRLGQGGLDLVPGWTSGWVNVTGNATGVAPPDKRAEPGLDRCAALAWSSVRPICGLTATGVTPL